MAFKMPMIKLILRHQIVINAMTSGIPQNKSQKYTIFSCPESRLQSAILDLKYTRQAGNVASQRNHACLASTIFCVVKVRRGDLARLQVFFSLKVGERDR